MLKKTLSIALIGLPLALQAAPKPRIAICHFQGVNDETGELQFKFKNLPEPAARAHLSRHFDAAVVPGEVVTIEVDGVAVSLDDDCDIVPG